MKEKGKNITNSSYSSMVEKATPGSPHLQRAIIAFLVGGLISAIGQIIMIIMDSFGIDHLTASSGTVYILIFTAQILTALGLYSRLAEYAGAGTLVPITGFANSVAAPAIEYKTEGIITGTCTKMFVIAGPVIVAGVTGAFIYGLIVWIFKLY